MHIERAGHVLLDIDLVDAASDPRADPRRDGTEVEVDVAVRREGEEREVSVGLSSVGAAEVMLSAQVSASYPEDDEKLSEVKVLVRNVGDAAVDLANGTLRVVVTKWE